MPAAPVSPLDPVREQFASLPPERPAGAPSHPRGRHRRRVPDRVVFDHVVAALVHGSGYERVASLGCSDRTIRRRVRGWAEAGRDTGQKTVPRMARIKRAKRSDDLVIATYPGRRRQTPYKVG